jgi:hypothetical protein
MAPSKKSPPWQEMRRTLSAKSKTDLLNLLRDLYALNPENQAIVRTQALAPKAPPRPKAVVQTIQRSAVSKAAPKTRRLAEIAAALRQGEHFEVTRLTTLKSLCEDAQAAAQFALYLAKLTARKMRENACPSHLDPETWDAYKELVAKALEHMDAYVEEPSEEASRAVWAVQSDVREVQNTYKHHQWGPVRMIHSSEVLLIEYALSCLLQPHASADWGYRLARQDAERYNSRYGTGLIPESAPMVEDIAEFWCQYHLGKPLQEWLGQS